MTSGTPGDAPERDVAAFARALAEFTADLRGLDAKALTPADRTVLRWLFDELTALIDTALHDHATPRRHPLAGRRRPRRSPPEQPRGQRRHICPCTLGRLDRGHQRGEA